MNHRREPSPRIVIDWYPGGVLDGHVAEGVGAFQALIITQFSARAGRSAIDTMVGGCGSGLFEKRLFMYSNAVDLVYCTYEQIIMAWPSHARQDPCTWAPEGIFERDHRDSENMVTVK